MMESTDSASSSVANPTHAVAAPNDWREKVMHKCRESVEVKEKFFDRYADAIGELAQKMADRFRDGHKLWVLGNGGSACDAQHIAVEFVHPIIEKRRALPAFDLVSQVPVLTAISNDKDYARIFVDRIDYGANPGTW
jgi:D-sedoheptulose 7-phosphate isomerase